MSDFNKSSENDTENLIKDKRLTQILDESVEKEKSQLAKNLQSPSKKISQEPVIGEKIEKTSKKDPLDFLPTDTDSKGVYEENSRE
ncbi:MAG: hypothetical protein WC606_00865 [Candidatus Absconditabacterales bacterium]|jgi:hypothetical protein